VHANGEDAVAVTTLMTLYNASRQLPAALASGMHFQAHHAQALAQQQARARTTTQARPQPHARQLLGNDIRISHSTRSNSSSPSSPSPRPSNNDSSSPQLAAKSASKVGRASGRFCLSRNSLKIE